MREEAVLSLQRPAILETQLRALLASADGRPLRIMFPMVGSVEEWRAARDMVQRLREEIAVSDLQVGIMIEVPSAMLLLEKVAPYIDFVSIGSNDLTQYLLAVDRNNPKVARLFDNLNPAVLVALQSIRRKCSELNLPVSLCGEMASDPASVMLLVAMGYDRLSLSAHRIPKIKWLIRQLNRDELLKLLAKANAAEDEIEIRKMLGRKLKTLGL